MRPSREMNDVYTIFIQITMMHEKKKLKIYI